MSQDRYQPWGKHCTGKGINVRLKVAPTSFLRGSLTVGTTSFQECASYHVLSVEPGANVQDVGPPPLLAGFSVWLQGFVPDRPTSGEWQQDHQQRHQNESRR